MTKGVQMLLMSQVKKRDLVFMNPLYKIMAQQLNAAILCSIYKLAELN